LGAGFPGPISAGVEGARDGPGVPGGLLRLRSTVSRTAASSLSVIGFIIVALSNISSRISLSSGVGFSLRVDIISPIYLPPVPRGGSSWI